MNAKSQSILSPRPNPEIRLLVRTMEKTWKELRAEQDFTRRKGHAAVLSALLDQLMDEPETVSGASKEGKVNDGEHWFTPEEMPEVNRFLEERPFDRAGPACDLFFFCTDTGKMSPLYTAPLLDPYQVRVLWHYGYHVHAMEKRYATDAPTTMHVANPEVCVQLLEAEGFGLSDNRGGPLAILIDPAGTMTRTPHSGFVVARGHDETIVVRAADFLSQCLKIRFLTVRVRISLCTH